MIIRKRSWIVILLMLGMITACEKQVDTYYLLTQKAGMLEMGDPIVVDGVTVGNVAQMEYPAGHPDFQMLRLELMLAVNLPKASSFIFPGKTSTNINAALYILPRPSDEVYRAGDTIKLLANTKEPILDHELGNNKILINQNESLEQSKKEIQEPKKKLVYRVQIRSSNKSIDIKDDIFNSLQPIEELKVGKLHKYYYGDASSLEEARVLRKFAVKKGFTDAFIVAFSGNRRIPVKEAEHYKN